jgi:hypothetical protein
MLGALVALRVIVTLDGGLDLRGVVESEVLCFHQQ